MALSWGMALVMTPVDATPALFAEGSLGPPPPACRRAGAVRLRLFFLLAILSIVFPSGDLPVGRWGFVHGCPRARLAVAVLAVFMPVISVSFPGYSTGVGVRNPVGVLPDLPFWSLITPDTVILPFIILLAGSVISLFVRFRRAAGIERQQLRWITAALGLLILGVFGGFAISAVVPGASDLSVAWIGPIVAIPLVPVAIGVAVLRYRLYEIDRIISRTISWALTTGLIGSLFGGLIVALQALLAPLTSESTLAVAGSTLAAAALFQPVRRRVQVTVDRRFNRRRYDADRTIEAFAEHLRGVTNLDEIEGSAVDAVARALGPSLATVWIRCHREVEHEAGAMADRPVPRARGARPRALGLGRAGLERLVDRGLVCRCGPDPALAAAARGRRLAPAGHHLRLLRGRSHAPGLRVPGRRWPRGHGRHRLRLDQRVEREPVLRPVRRPGGAVPDRRFAAGRFGLAGRIAVAVPIAFSPVLAFAPSWPITFADGATAQVRLPFAVARLARLAGAGRTRLPRRPCSPGPRDRDPDRPVPTCAGPERAQFKWLLAALAATLATVIFAFAMILLVDANGTWMWFPAVLAYPMIPVSILVAIRRYHLYDIDRIVSRSVSYLVVTGLLCRSSRAGACDFRRCSPGSPRATRSRWQRPPLPRPRCSSRSGGASRHRGPPLRSARYDGQRTVDAFAEQLRNEVEPDAARSLLLETSSTAVQPSSAAIWLRSVHTASPTQIS